MIAPPKFSNVDICLEEFLYFLEDIGALKSAISIEDVSSALPPKPYASCVWADFYAVF
jgi:hypothetical protein